MKDRNIKIIIKYNGSKYHGWQKQIDKKTIQEEIEKAAYKALNNKIYLIGSGRTDAGVHALGQTANFIIKHKIPDDKIKYALNTKLSKDIRIVDSIEVPLEFHSRYATIGKTYKYNIYNSRVMDPFLKDISNYVPSTLNLEKIYSAMKFFIGKHDFKSFMSSGSSTENTVREIYDFKLKKNNNLLTFNITGNGFLYNMVRIIIGTLIEVGKGRLEIEDVKNILEAKDRKISGHTAKPEGLFLKKVYYEHNKEEFHKEISKHD